MSEWEEEGCDFLGPEECEERMDEKGLDIGQEEKKHFRETDEGL